MIIPKTEYTEEKIVVDLTGPEGNAFILLVTAKRLAKELLQYNDKETEELLDEMGASDYENLVETFDRHFGHYVILLR